MGGSLHQDRTLGWALGKLNTCRGRRRNPHENLNLNTVLNGEGRASSFSFHLSVLRQKCSLLRSCELNSPDSQLMTGCFFLGGYVYVEWGSSALPD